jgi:hypothetical protein
MTVVETCYISTGCNRTPHCADWGCSGLICFGACRSVSIYQPEVWFYPAIPGLFSLKFIYSRSYSLCCLLLHQGVRQEWQISTKLYPSLCHYFFYWTNTTYYSSLHEQLFRPQVAQSNRASTPSKSTSPNSILLARKKIVIFQIWGWASVCYSSFIFFLLFQTLFIPLANLVEIRIPKTFSVCSSSFSES